MCPYPEDTQDEMAFDDVVVYDVGAEYKGLKGGNGGRKVAIVTYGNGVRTALQYAHAQAREANQQQQQQQQLCVTVIDSPCISRIPAQLPAILCQYPPPLIHVHAIIIQSSKHNSRSIIILPPTPPDSTQSSLRTCANRGQALPLIIHYETLNPLSSAA